MINTKAAMIISLTKYIKNSQNWEILEPRWQFNNAECLFWREFKTLKTHMIRTVRLSVSQTQRRLFICKKVICLKLLGSSFIRKYKNKPLKQFNSADGFWEPFKLEEDNQRSKLLTISSFEIQKEDPTDCKETT